MASNIRAVIAADTLSILEAGAYTIHTGTVSIAEAMADCLDRTRLYTPTRVEAMTRAWVPRTTGAGRVSVTAETTLHAIARLAGAPGLAALNFASAKNPGGGFLGGAQAQEESLARSSGLYPSLLRCPEYYEANRASGSMLYTDHLIRSPGVPVFRNDSGALLEQPVRVNMLTSPAPNAGVARERGERGVLETLRRRAAQVLTVAAEAGDQTLILGAWGCGVFRNDPDEVAETFDTLLRGPYQGAFDEVVFAIRDSTRDQAVLHAFQRRLGSRQVSG